VRILNSHGDALMAGALHVSAAPVFYGDDRTTVHIGYVAWNGPRPPQPHTLGRGLCPVVMGRDMTLAEGVSVTCPACLAEANRLAAAKEARR
jgi:hypothetical protein